MKKMQFTIRGTSPMLMHRYPMDAEQGGEAKRKGEQYDPVEDAQKGLYQNDQGCFIPSTWIEACLREAGKAFKKGKATYKAIIQSSTFISPDEIPMGLKTYDSIDRRPAVVQRNRIVRSRPMFKPGWQITFDVEYDEQEIKEEVLLQILTEAGRVKGIGDYRPKFGRFEVVSSSGMAG